MISAGLLPDAETEKSGCNDTMDTREMSSVDDMEPAWLDRLARGPEETALLGTERNAVEIAGLGGVPLASACVVDSVR